MKERNNLLPLDGGKPRQEVIDRRAALQVVDERLGRNARPGKDKDPAPDVQCRTNDGLGHGLTFHPAGAYLKAPEVRPAPRVSGACSRPSAASACRTALTVSVAVLFFFHSPDLELTHLLRHRKWVGVTMHQLPI